MKLIEHNNQIFNIRTDIEFNDAALEIFHYQYNHNTLYAQFVDYHIKNTSSIDHYSKIPFLPIEFFKSHIILCEDNKPEKCFVSSGTTGINKSRHYISSLFLYERSFVKSFEMFYGKPDDYLILALLPSYLEREDSSLVYMVSGLIKLSGNSNSGFYLDNLNELAENLRKSETQKVILIGVSYALLELAENHDLNIPDVTVIETGGMKGRRREMVKDELHTFLCEKFKVEKIHSEYGMTELLSQAYSKGDGLFKSPPWMKILIRDTNDPKSLLRPQRTGGLNIIDLANMYSCSFIATQDLGKVYSDDSFEVLGRFDNSDIRGCNLMYE